MGMRASWRCAATAVIGLAVLALAVSVASAAPPRTAVVELYAEPALRDDAGAVTLLLRAALDHPDRPVVPLRELAEAVGTDGERVVVPIERAGGIAATLGAKWLVIGELIRHGPRIHATLHVLDASGEPVDHVQVDAHASDLVGLATQLVDGVSRATGERVGRVPSVSVGQLRRFVRATAAWRSNRKADAIASLDGADPLIALKVPPAQEAARALWNDTTLGIEDRLRAALAAGSPADVIALASGDSAAARGARALAAVALSDAAAVEKELKAGGSHPWLTLARAQLGRLRRDGKARDQALRQLTATAPATLLFVARLAPGELSTELEASFVAAAEKIGAVDPRAAAVLGLRAAEGNVELRRALAVISVRELDDAEVVRLGPVVDRALAAGVHEAHRLSTELAMRAGDLAAAATRLDAWEATGPDPLAALARGRLAIANGDPRAAAEAFARAGELGATERAAAQLAAGDAAAARGLTADAKESVLAHLAAAELALASGKTDVAIVELRAAAALSPASADVQRRLARALELAGDRDGAAKAIALAKKLDPKGTQTTAIGLGTNAGVTAGAAGPVATEVKPGAGGPAALAAVVKPLLAELPPIARLHHKKVVVVPLAGGEPGWFALREARPAPLRQAIVDVLGAPPWQIDVIATAPPAVSEPLTQPGLQALAQLHGADGIVLYRITAEGTQAVGKLVAWDARSDRAFEIPIAVDGARFGLVGWHMAPIVVLGGLGGSLVVFGLLWALRGRGVIEVRIKMDPAGTDEAFCVQIGRGGRPPAIGAPDAWRDSLRRAGQQTARKSATLIPKISRYPIGAGRWTVHLYGVYTRGGDVRVVEGAPQEVVVKRGQVAAAVFDLAPTTAELRIHVHDEHRAGIGLWIDDRVAQKVFTNADGDAVLQMPLGEHTLHVEARGLSLERPIAIATPRIERIEINLVRERKLAEVSDGLSLRRTAAVAAPAPAPEPVKPAVAKTTVLAPAPTPMPAPRATADADSGIRIDEVLGDRPVPAPVPVGAMPTVAFANSTPAPRIAVGTRPGPGSTLLGRYRVDDILGQGAMGIVYRAWDQNLERAVAIKALGAEMKQFPDAMTFFVQEAKALAQLNHPNIVAVYDQTSERDETYMIMELVEGRTLESVLADKGGKLPVSAALRIVDQLCAGLAYAHSRKVIHRDIKPANVFVSQDGVVKLGDFGLARVMREIAIRRTEIRGTPLYMAPEQITGTNVNHRADLYAVGCTLFELLTGRPPFVDGDVMYHHLHTEPVAPSTLVKGVPAELDALVLQCLVKDTAMRVETADVIREGLRTVPRT